MKKERSEPLYINYMGLDGSDVDTDILSSACSVINCPMIQSQRHTFTFMHTCIHARTQTPVISAHAHTHRERERERERERDISTDIYLNGTMTVNPSSILLGTLYRQYAVTALDQYPYGQQLDLTHKASLFTVKLVRYCRSRSVGYIILCDHCQSWYFLMHFVL